MGQLTTTLFGVGVIWMLGYLVAAGIEVATVRLIRAPKRRSFTRIRLMTTQYQTVFAPALGALVSGVFVSLSATFFWTALTETDADWQAFAGAAALILGLVVLLTTIGLAVREGTDAASLATDPFTILAAATEVQADARHAVLGPRELAAALDRWAERIAAYSLNASPKAHAEELLPLFEETVDARAFWPSFRASVRVFFRTARQLPVRRGWPLIGLLVFLIGSLLFVAQEATTWTGSIAVLILWMSGAACLLLCAWARGNRTRSWYRIYRAAVAEARVEIEAAEEATRDVQADDARLDRVMRKADAYLREETPCMQRKMYVNIPIGPLRLIIFDGCRPERRR